MTILRLTCTAAYSEHSILYKVAWQLNIPKCGWLPGSSSAKVLGYKRVEAEDQLPMLVNLHYLVHNRTILQETLTAIRSLIYEKHFG